MPEYTYDPTAGEAVEVHRGMSAPEPSDSNIEEASHQEKTDFWVENARNNTAQHLAERTTHSNPGEVQASDQELFALQAQLSKAHEAGDLLLVEKLQAQVLQAAEAAVAAPNEATPDNDPLDISEARQQHRNDPAVAEGMSATERLVEDGVLDESTLQLIQNGLASDSAELLDLTANTMKEMGQSPEAFARVESAADVGALDDTQVGWFADNYSQQVADDVEALNYGVRSGKLSFNEAFRMAAKGGLLQPMLRASRANIGFNIASGF